jgi:hypothetical protein
MQIATLVSIGSRRLARLGGSPQSVTSRARSAVPSGPMDFAVAADTLPLSKAFCRARSFSTRPFASRSRQLGPPRSSLAESAGFGGLSVSQGTRKCALAFVAGFD